MKSSSALSSFAKKTLLVLGCAASFVFIAAPVLKAADAPPATTAAALPLDVKIEKVTGNEKIFVVKLTNHSKTSIKVIAKVLLAVAMHGDEKARHIPAHTIDAGKDFSIDQLSFDDHVIVTAEGFAPLEIKVK